MSAPVSEAMLCYLDALCKHDVDGVGATLSDDLVFVSATRLLNKAQFLAMLKALYAGFPDWKHDYGEIENRGQGNYAVKWHQSGMHTGTWTMPGMDPIGPTGKHVEIPSHYFFYRVAGEKLVLIFPEPIPGGAPRGILEQIGVEVPPL